MYAIVKSGGKQHKVAVGDELEVERGLGAVGATVALPAVLLVDDGTVTTDAATLAGVNVTAEILAETKGPKIRIIKYKNKTGYRKRQGHRQGYLRVKVTGIETATTAGKA
ncbi:MAG TPA: 50S ribosomal protein L21 [Mycobacteriales bacterium]